MRAFFVRNYNISGRLGKRSSLEGSMQNGAEIKVDLVAARRNVQCFVFPILFFQVMQHGENIGL